MDQTKWNETLLCPRCGSGDTDIGWTNGDGVKATEKIYTEIPVIFSNLTISSIYFHQFLRIRPFL
jgi:hypothetical protein